MFMGEFNHSIDAKGRLIIPSKLRDQLGETFVITKGLDGCLFIYTNDEWQNIEKKFREVPLTTKDARKFSRFFFAGASQMEIDKQGRILIPSLLREFAGLQKEVVLVGVLDRVEVWDKDKWENNIDFDDDDMDEIAEHMAELGVGI
jgi:MraZ protein